MTKSASSNPARGAARMSGRRLAVGMILLLLVAGVTLRLGFWQLSRAEQKREIMAEIQAGRDAAPLALVPETPPDELRPWRRAWARGVWLPDFTILLDNRNQDGHPGYWVMTPLCLLPADAPELDDRAPGRAVECPAAIAVLRGWVMRPRPGEQAAALPPLPALPFDATVEGELLARVPRLFDLRMLGGDDAPERPAFEASGEPPVLQNLALEAYAGASGLHLLPAVLQQTGPTAVDGLRREWAGPAADAEKNHGYALQWFSFAAIALVAFGVLLVHTFRRSRPRRT
ncbi:MAG: SURF1 family protein [Pigmentiphaga sp.]